jgi:hypothetical protein
MKPSFAMKLAPVLVLGCLAAPASAQMYAPPMGYPQPNGGYPTAYNPYYGYMQPALPMNYYQPMPSMPNVPAVTAMPAAPFQTVLTANPAAPAAPEPAPATTCGGDGRCGSDCIPKNCCDSGCNKWTCEVGAAANVLRPFFHSNPTFFTSQIISAAAPAVVGASSSDFDWSYTVSPTIWLDITSPSGIGLRAQYFRFDQRSQDASFVIPNPNTNAVQVAGAAKSPSPLVGGTIFIFGPSTNTATSDLNVETVDLAGTYSLRPARWLLTFLAGGRYLDTQEDYGFSSVSSATGALILDASYRHGFAGGGPLLGFEFHRYIGNSGLSAYGKIDGALLAGSGSETFIQNSPAFGTTVVSNKFNPLLTVVDVELGAEFMLNRGGGFRPFLRAAVVDQTYWDAGSASSAMAT